MNQLAQKIVTVTQEYLGPASERFINRQATLHLKVGLHSLTPEHLDELAHWVHTSAGLLIDKEKAEELAEKIKQLGN